MGDVFIQPVFGPPPGWGMVWEQGIGGNGSCGGSNLPFSAADGGGSSCGCPPPGRGGSGCSICQQGAQGGYGPLPTPGQNATNCDPTGVSGSSAPVPCPASATQV